jgi:hypothetical protein
MPFYNMADPSFTRQSMGLELGLSLSNMDPVVLSIGKNVEKLSSEKPQLLERTMELACPQTFVHKSSTAKCRSQSHIFPQKENSVSPTEHK